MYAHLFTYVDVFLVSLCLYVCMCVCMYCMHACMLAYLSCVCVNVYVCMHVYIDGQKGGAMGLQPHLILRVLYRILIFIMEILSKLAPPGFAIFLHHCMRVHMRMYIWHACKINVYCVCMYLCMYA